MKVLHLSSEKFWRGGEQQIAYLIEELKKYGVINIVACRKNSSFESYCMQEQIPFISLPFKNSLDIKTAVSIRNYANKEKADIIHMHSGKSHTIGVIATFLGAKASLILSRRVQFPVKKGWFSRWKYNYPRIKRILCVSDKIRAIVSANLKDPNKCVTVYSGIDEKRFSPERKTGFLRKKYGILSDIYLVGNISAISPEKDYYTFLKTAGKVLEQRKDIRFFIIGEGPMESEMKAYVALKGLEKYVFFTGFLSNIPEVLPELDIFLITSKSEGLGTTVLDAFLSEVPVVSTNAGGIPEMVIHEQTGLIADVEDADSLAGNILRLLDSQELQKTLKINAREHLKNFTKQRMAKMIYLQYEEALEE